MSEGKRPGGLTALAVLNFVFGGFGALGLLVLFGLLSAAEQASGGEVSTAIAKSPNAGLLWAVILLGLVSVVLMIASGVGYLGQKRVLGRGVGNAYALTSLAQSGLSLAVAPFGIGTMIGLVYPLLTLMLINTTFKDDLVN